MSFLLALALTLSTASTPHEQATSRSNTYDVTFNLEFEGMRLIRGSKICQRDQRCVLIENEGKINKISVKVGAELLFYISCSEPCSFRGGRRFLFTQEKNIAIVAGRYEPNSAVWRTYETIGTLLLTVE